MCSAIERAGSNPKVVPAAALANSMWQVRSTRITPIGNARTNGANGASEGEGFEATLLAGATG